MRGYLTLKDGVPTLITPEGSIKLDFNPPPKYMNHIVKYNRKTHKFILDRKYGD